MGHGEVSPLLVCTPLYIYIYPYHFTVCYIPGVTNQLGDCLLRLGGHKDTIKLTELHVYQITHHLYTRSDSLNQLRVSTQTGDELALLKYTIMQG